MKYYVLKKNKLHYEMAPSKNLNKMILLYYFTSELLNNELIQNQGFVTFNLITLINVFF